MSDKQTPTVVEASDEWYDMKGNQPSLYHSTRYSEQCWSLNPLALVEEHAAENGGMRCHLVQGHDGPHWQLCGEPCESCGGLDNHLHDCPDIGSMNERDVWWKWDR